MYRTIVWSSNQWQIDKRAQRGWYIYVSDRAQFIWFFSSFLGHFPHLSQPPFRKKWEKKKPNRLFFFFLYYCVCVCVCVLFSFPSVSLSKMCSLFLSWRSTCRILKICFVVSKQEKSPFVAAQQIGPHTLYTRRVRPSIVFDCYIKLYYYKKLKE